MKKINFTKMVASGNDFVLMESHELSVSPAGRQVKNYKSLAKDICNRKYGAGADGLLVLEKSSIADARMRIFNSDGSEAQMCGNGARCSILYLGKDSGKLETKAGIIEGRLEEKNVKIKLTDPDGIKLDISIKVDKRNLRVNFINTGVPHAVIFVEGLDEIHVGQIGRVIRNHDSFAPFGANVDFAEVLGEDLIGIRTYERGVEDETLACGTGTVASAIIFALKLGQADKVNVITKSGEILKVYFNRTGNKFRNVWLEGKAKIAYKGEYYV